MNSVHRSKDWRQSSQSSGFDPRNGRELGPIDVKNDTLRSFGVAAIASLMMWAAILIASGVV